MKRIALLVLSFLSMVAFAQEYTFTQSSPLTFTDISTTGTALNISDDDAVNITSPFTIYLGGQGSTDLLIGNNGAILFGVTTGAIDPDNTSLSSSTPMIAPYWDDLYDESGNVYYWSDSSKLIIQWDRSHYDDSVDYSPSNAKFQVVFWKGSDNIYFFYDDVDFGDATYNNGTDATIGIATNEAVFQYSIDTATLSAGDLIKYTPAKSSITDLNFENYLETHTTTGTTVAVGHNDAMGDGTLGNGTVITANIDDVTNLDISNQSISNLTGIANFTAMTILNASENALTSVDLNSNTAITALMLRDNNLGSLDVTSLDNLQGLYIDDNANLSAILIGNKPMLYTFSCQNNNLMYLHIDNAPNIGRIYASNNRLLGDLDFSDKLHLEGIKIDGNPNVTSLDLRNGNNSSILDSEFDTRNNPYLTCIYVDDVSFSTVNWMSLDAMSTFIIDETACNALYTYVPDDLFEYTLQQMGKDVGALNDYVPTNQLQTIIDLDIDDVQDFGGITAMTNLETLSISNYHTGGNLDLSNAPNLRSLYVLGSVIPAIDLTQNTALENLDLLSVGLTSFDISANTNLKYLTLALAGNFSSIDLSNHTALIKFTIEQMNYTTLDLSTNTVLEEVTLINSPYLASVNFGTNSALKKIRVNTCPNIETLGLTNLANLNFLNCNDNNIDNLDVSQNIFLKTLQCTDNDLVNLNVLSNTRLENVAIGGNNFTTFDLRNGANYNMNTFNSAGSPNLTCVYVDNPTTANANWTIYKDVYTNLVADATACSNIPTTYVPDDNFEQTLIDLGYDIALDDYINTDVITSITSLNVMDKAIVSMQGIEAFTALETLQCKGNNIVSIDLSQNTALKELYIYENQLTGLNVTANTLLEKLYCAENPNIGTLNLGYNGDLLQLSCGNTGLSTLDLDSNLELTTLYCGNNNLTSLELELHDNLSQFVCWHNQITSLDLSNNANLILVFCNDNALSLLDLRNGANSVIGQIDGKNNANLCVLVDDVNASSVATWPLYFDASAHILETNAECSALYVDETSLSGLQVYPNPTQDTVMISMEQQDDYIITVYNLLGEQVLSLAISQSNEAQIALTNLPNGVYMIRVFASTNNKSKVMKIVKK